MAFCSFSPSGIPNYGEHRAHGYPLCSMPSIVYSSSSSDPGISAMNPTLSNSMESSSTLTNPAPTMNSDLIWASSNISRCVANSEYLNDLPFTGSWVNTTPCHVSPMHPTTSGQSSEQQGACKNTAQKEIPYTCCHKYKRQEDATYPSLYLG